MAKREYHSRFECPVLGCTETGNYISQTRSEQTDTYRRYSNGKWRCVRHSRPDEVLDLTNLSRTSEFISEEKFYEKTSIGYYWGNFGFVSGPGFKAWSKDFPVGTKLRVTAEIILPIKS